MEKLKNIIKIIFPGLIVYAIIILIFASFVSLYKLKEILILSFIQFTWPFALGIICVSIFHYYSTIMKLKHHDYQKNDLFFQDNLFFNELEKNEKKYNDERSEIIHKQQVRENYFQLWSHEIKTPLTRIKLMLQNSSLVQSNKLNEQIIVIQNQLDSLLSYERLNNFNNDLHFNKVNLENTCNRSIKKLMELAISKNISIHNNVGNLVYLTDERWFEVIIQQLLLNAIKYTDNNGEIVINYQNHVFSITDNGIGILATDLPNVFKAGFIGGNSRNNENSSGLGLYLVKQICDILNIQIQIISKINFGTTIKLYLDSQMIE